MEQIILLIATITIINLIVSGFTFYYILESVIKRKKTQTSTKEKMLKELNKMMGIDLNNPNIKNPMGDLPRNRKLMGFKIENDGR